MNVLIAKLQETIVAHRLFTRGDTIVIGVSGGPDSTALLLALMSLPKEWDLTLHVAHLNHGLRGDAEADASFVQRLTEKLEIPLTMQTARIRPHGTSLEEAARQVRITFLCGVAKRINASTIALGHTLDDQAETVLMRLVRGAGLSGLSAIAPKRAFGRFRIVRPLIGVTRKEILAYLKKKRCAYRVDRSNFEDVYMRNRIRYELIPLLASRYNKNIKEVLARTAEHVADDYEYLRSKAARYVIAGRSTLDLPLLKKAHPAMRRLMVRLAIERTKGDLRTIDFRHSEQIDRLLTSGRLNAVVDLPKNVSVVKKNRSLHFYLRAHGSRKTRQRRHPSSKTRIAS